MHPEKGSCHQPLGHDPQGKVWQGAPTRSHQPPGKRVENTTPAVNLSASPTQHSLHLASTHSPGPMISSLSDSSESYLTASEPSDTPPPLESLCPHPPAPSPRPSVPPGSEAWPPSLMASAGHPSPGSSLTPPQCDRLSLPMTNIPYYCPQITWTQSPIQTMSGQGRSTRPFTSVSWCDSRVAKALSLSEWSQPESGRGEPLGPPTGAPFWGYAKKHEVEAGSPIFISPDLRKLLEILMQKRVQMKVWKERKETEESDSHPVFQPQHWTPSGTQSWAAPQAQFKTQTHVTPSSPIPPPSGPAQSGFCGASSPPSQKRSRTFSPMGIQNHLLQKQLESKSSVPVHRNLQAGHSKVPSISSQDFGHSQTLLSLSKRRIMRPFTRCPWKYTKNILRVGASLVLNISPSTVTAHLDSLSSISSRGADPHGPADLSCVAHFYP
ncbi:spermatogenesis-associated protein 31E1-like isoform X2 [Talpa occidentalis]|nr:spermatogenesis-associated protein 31E1-like isoform X2 [Talpa occidentalis]XP_054544540.1 spermatogenesis-associated protein 31E1-like isoform X2 [Talpa occidentalis]XP_054544541.1 spermatogenesis-associated protein 31E1-like isoform X2 [Talpa occidentalis]XP_054544542.1 spermatogenesis-associated protein 31E1-like isoform X2 [Talpa occidentalis]XP_054544543.1 spermatogenesis-associated protein 31E1-like isoform X2 [Talpa occidentalis]